MPGERTMSPGPKGGSPPSGPDRAMLDAAQGVLTTLSAGRAALLQLAAAHLTFDRLLVLHRHAAGEVDTLEGVSGLVDRRMGLHLRAVGGGHTSAPPTPSSVAPPLAPGRPGRAASRRPAVAVSAAPPPAAAEPAPSPPVAALRGANVPRGGPERIARSLLADRSSRAAAPPPVDPTPDALRDLAVAAARAVPDAPGVIVAPIQLVELKHPDDDAAAALAAGAAFGDHAWDEPSYVGPLEELSAEQTGPASGADAIAATLTDATDVPVPMKAPFAPRAVAAPSPLFDSLSDWAASALGTPAAPVAGPGPHLARSEDDENAPQADFVADPERQHEHSVLDMSDGEAALGVTPGESTNENLAALPKIREPRVAGASVAMLNVRAAGTAPAPRTSSGDTIELQEDDAPQEAGEDDSPEHAADSAGMSVTFESHAPVRAPRSAPRLTEEDPSDVTQAVPASARAPLVPDQKVVQKLLDTANAHARKGEFHKAIQLYTDALDMRHTLVEAHIGRGRCHLELGDYSSAMSDFARAEDHAPDRPDAHVAMGDLYFARKEYKRAIEFYDQAVEIDGSHAMARCRRGISHYYRKNFRQACQDLQRALALDPEIPNIRKYVQMAQKKLERGE